MAVPRPEQQMPFADKSFCVMYLQIGLSNKIEVKWLVEIEIEVEVRQRISR